MPGRSRTTTRPEVNADYKFRILDILNNTDDSMTLDEIRMNDMILRPLSNQKISRLISDLIDFGLVQKGKSKSLGRMMYKATSKMREQGYEVDEPKDLQYNYVTQNLEKKKKKRVKERID